MKKQIASHRRPIGSPHTVEPPVFPHFSFRDPEGIGPINNRVYSRRSKTHTVYLIDREDNNVLRCRSQDIGDGGLFGTCPIGYGLAVGQRYEVRIGGGEDATLASPEQMPSLGYASVTRVEMNLARQDNHRIGFAVKFDVPQLLPV